jgi:signal peptidase II
MPKTGSPKDLSPPPANHTPETTTNSPANKTAEKLSGYALTSVKAHLRLWPTMMVGLLADLGTKKWAVNTIGMLTGNDQIPDPESYYRPMVIIDNYLRFATLHNPGALAGLAAGKTTLLIAASGVAVVFLLWLFATSRSSQWFTHIALGMLFAGALGNLYNRLFNNGLVIDFIEVNLHFWPANPWPTFNVADILLCVGVALLMLTLIRNRPHLAPQ